MARKCKENGIIFVGPDHETIGQMGDKTAAKKLAAACDVPTIPGTTDALKSKEEAVKWCAENGLPVMMKAALGGGGRGMRVVRKEEEIVESFERC